MKSEITDVWFRSGLRLADIDQRLGMLDVNADAENYWAWVIGTLGDARLDITRTHTWPAHMVETRVFVVDGEFTEPLLTELVARLRGFVSGPIACGRWEYRSGDDFDLVLVRKFGPTSGGLNGGNS